MISAELTRTKNQALLGRRCDHVVGTDKPPTDASHRPGFALKAPPPTPFRLCVTDRRANFPQRRALPAKLVASSASNECLPAIAGSETAVGRATRRRRRINTDTRTAKHE